MGGSVLGDPVSVSAGCRFGGWLSRRGGGEMRCLPKEGRADATGHCRSDGAPPAPGPSELVPMVTVGIHLLKSKPAASGLRAQGASLHVPVGLIRW